MFRRGPALGGVCLRIRTAFLRRHAGTDCRSAVRPRHAGDSWFDRARSALSNQLSATSWLPHHEPGEVQNHQHSGIRRASARRAKRRWSDSSLQVEDPKASGTPTCLAATCATIPSSATIVVAHYIMKNGPRATALDEAAWQHHSQLQPSSTWSERSRTVTRSSQLVAAPLSCCACGTATSERAASCSHCVRPRVPRWPSGHSTATLRGDIGLSQRAAACSRRPRC